MGNKAASDYNKGRYGLSGQDTCNILVLSRILILLWRCISLDNLAIAVFRYFLAAYGYLCSCFCRRILFEVVAYLQTHYPISQSVVFFALFLPLLPNSQLQQSGDC